MGNREKQMIKKDYEYIYKVQKKWLQEIGKQAEKQKKLILNEPSPHGLNPQNIYDGGNKC